MKDLIEDTIKAMEELEEVNKNSIPAEKKNKLNVNDDGKKVKKEVKK